MRIDFSNEEGYCDAVVGVDFGRFLVQLDAVYSTIVPKNEHLWDIATR